jgi:hypothetical protein
MRELDGDRREALVSRIAEALSRRRSRQTPDDTDIGLVVNVDRDHFQPGRGLSEAAMRKLTELVEQRIDEERRDR